MGMHSITPFLWFDSQAEAAARHYTGIFPNSKILNTERYPEGAPGPAGSVMTVDFELNGQFFTALNGGPMFRFNESVSFVIHCKDQAEVDHYWDRLLEGGSAQQCGWLKDRFGLSWQVVPEALFELTRTSDAVKTRRAFAAMMQMVKFDIRKLEEAARA